MSTSLLSPESIPFFLSLSSQVLGIQDRKEKKGKKWRDEKDEASRRRSISSVH